MLDSKKAASLRMIQVYVNCESCTGLVSLSKRKENQCIRGASSLFFNNFSFVAETAHSLSAYHDMGILAHSRIEDTRPLERPADRRVVG